jgi:hypothetical protein
MAPCFKSALAGRQIRKKKRTGWEGSRRSAGLRGKASVRLLLGGWGAEKTELAIKPIHRG